MRSNGSLLNGNTCAGDNESSNEHRMKNHNVRAHISAQHKPSIVVEPWETLESPSSIELPSSASLIGTPGCVGTSNGRAEEENMAKFLNIYHSLLLTSYSIIHIRGNGPLSITLRLCTLIYCNQDLQLRFFVLF